jgi:hypothetical protein
MIGPMPNDRTDRALVTWPQVLAFRMRRQLLDPVASVGVVDVARRLCGIQSQVPAAAGLAVAVRQAEPTPGGLARALADRQLLRTWAMRGALHALDPAEAGAYLALVGASRYWERGSWQRTFGVTPDEMEELVAAVADALDGRVLTREELVAAVVERLDRPDLEEQLRSGWGAVLKPVAWQGYLCHGPADGNRVTFARPDTWPGWRGVPRPEEAAPVAIPAYLRAYGPATIDTFDAWLTRGTSKRKALRGWFTDLDDRLATVDIAADDGGGAEPRTALLVAEDVDELVGTPPTDAVRLLPGFDQYVLGPGTGAAEVVPPARRSLVSKTAGWISPVVVAGGRVAGVWEEAGGEIQVRLFEEGPPVAGDALDGEVARIASLLDRPLALTVTII